MAKMDMMYNIYNTVYIEIEIPCENVKYIDRLSSVNVI